MESKLMRLFDFQNFEGSKALADVISSVHSRYTKRELKLSELEYLAAAGVPEMPKKKDDRNF